MNTQETPTARFDGQCAACRGPITTGDPIGFAKDGARWRAVHHRCQPARPETVALDGVAIRALLTGAQANGLKWPKLTLVDGRTRVSLSLAGAASRNPGSVNVTDGGRYPNNQWFGRIDVGGAFHPARECTPEVVALLRELATDPAATAAAHGHRSGSCCFCTRELNDPRSTEVGYGPVCAERFGLPWGDDRAGMAPLGLEGWTEVQS